MSQNIPPRPGTRRYYFIILSIIFTNFNVIVDCMIGAPEHEKDMVDGIDSYDKRYLMRKMCMIGALKADDSKKGMNTNSMVSNTWYSLAKECKRLCKDEIIINSVKSHIKYKNKEGNNKVKKRVYHLQDKDDVEMQE